MVGRSARNNHACSSRLPALFAPWQRATLWEVGWRTGVDARSAFCPSNDRLCATNALSEPAVAIAVRPSARSIGEYAVATAGNFRAQFSGSIGTPARNLCCNAESEVER